MCYGVLDLVLEQGRGLENLEKKSLEGRIGRLGGYLDWLIRDVMRWMHR